MKLRYGPDAVFWDTDTLRVGDTWPEVITNALQRATVVIAMIGPRWLFAQDAAGRRRIDSSDDWVRNEIAGAMARGTPVMPVLIAGAALPLPEALPEALRGLPAQQAILLQGKSELSTLFATLEKNYSFIQLGNDLDYPTPIDRSPEMQAAELEAALEGLDGWSRIERDSDHARHNLSEELEKVFKFRTFEDAIHFMATAARYITNTEHHPNWQNQYKDLRVRLTSWDIGHRISFKDVRLAQYLDRLHRDYQST